MKKIPLYAQIMVGILAAFGWYGAHHAMGWELQVSLPWIAPLGKAFLNALKALTMPLVVTSLVVGVSSIDSATRLSRLGFRTMLAYTVTTVFAVCLGVFIGNVFRPGHLMDAVLREELMRKFGAGKVVALGAGQAYDTVPANLFHALAHNDYLLQIVVFALLFGVALLGVPRRNKEQVIVVLEGCNQAFIGMIGMVMQVAPLGIFALIVSLLAELGNPSNVQSYLQSVLGYFLAACGGLFAMTFVVYPCLLLLLTKMHPWRFLKAMQPAQLIAFGTSSSSATLPVTTHCVNKKLGVPEEISSFVLPLGATVNMDGTAIYQGVTVMFIAQAFQMDLSLSQQFLIVAYVSLSSVGVAGVPGASMGTTATLLQMLGIPSMGIGLISLTDRFLDMLRTVTNITGDALVAVLVADAEMKHQANKQAPELA